MPIGPSALSAECTQVRKICCALSAECTPELGVMSCSAECSSALCVVLVREEEEEEEEVSFTAYSK